MVLPSRCHLVEGFCDDVGRYLLYHLSKGVEEGDNAIDSCLRVIRFARFGDDDPSGCLPKYGWYRFGWHLS